MSADLRSVDRRVMQLVERHRRACAALHRGVAAPPLADRLLEDEALAELAQSDEVLARAIVAWLEALREERHDGPLRAEAASLLHAPREVAHLEATTSLAALRRAILTERSDARAGLHAAAWSQHAGPLSDRLVAGWVERLERSRAALEVVVPASALARLGTGPLAERFLRASDDVARALAPSDPVAGLRAALGREAGEGWPAKLNAAWLEDRFRPAGWLEGRRPGAVALPPPLGATSFARALGSLGVALLEEGRAPGVPWCLHQHPRGIRRHRRRALFASLVASERFAQRALGLGRDRAREQRRRVARAFLVSLRIDAARVCLLEALTEGEGVARELFPALGERLFGHPPPRSWLATLPRLAATSAPWFVGCLAAFADEASLVERFDDDWFDNPRAAEALRSEDAGPDDAWPRPTVAGLLLGEDGGKDEDEGKDEGEAVARATQALEARIDALARALEHAAG